MILKIKPDLDKIEFNLPDGRTSNELLAKQGKERSLKTVGLRGIWDTYSDTQINIFVGERGTMNGKNREMTWCLCESKRIISIPNLMNLCPFL
jgi:hypothetical protein